MAGAKKKLQWWLEPGTETCSECGHAYVYETEYRCIGCDVTICSICVGDFIREILCISCRRVEG